jgi:hypothetical protein
MKLTRSRLALLCAGSAAALGALLGHRWLELGWNAWRYATAESAARTQVVVAQGRAWVAAGADGIEVVDLAAGERMAILRLPAPADRIDDLALADGMLFALDATPPGHLIAYRAGADGRPAAPGAIVEVPVGPFSGVSAAAGLVAVSGGTSRLTVREYDREGRLGPEVASADYGRGQPDVVLSPDGAMAAISTHLVGPRFALTLVEVRRRPLRLRVLGQLELRDAGFTADGFHPAHFPLVAAWRGERIYVADGGGLSVVDVSAPERPRILLRDRRAGPASDLALAGDELDVARAGARPAVLRYRLDAAGYPAATGIWSPPVGSRLAAIARHGPALVATRHEQGWRMVDRGEFDRWKEQTTGDPRRER